MVRELPENFPLRSAVDRAQRLICEMVAYCPSWQEWCGVNRAADALAFIQHPWVDDQTLGANGGLAKLPKPILVVLRKSPKYSTAAEGGFATVPVELLFHDKDRFPGDRHLGQLDFDGRVGAVIEELIGLSDRDREGSDSSWPRISGVQETQESVWGELADGLPQMWLCAYEITFGGIDA